MLTREFEGTTRTSGLSVFSGVFSDLTERVCLYKAIIALHRKPCSHICVITVLFHLYLQITASQTFGTFATALKTLKPAQTLLPVTRVVDAVCSDSNCFIVLCISFSEVIDYCRLWKVNRLQTLTIIAILIQKLYVLFALSDAFISPITCNDLCI